jgi:hypothetical protein
LGNPVGGTDASDRASFLDALEALAAAVDALDSSLEGVHPFVDQARLGLQAGRPLAAIVRDLLESGAGTARVEISATIRRYEKAMQTVRAQAARAMGVSPQMARRLYNLGRPPPQVPPA